LTKLVTMLNYEQIAKAFEVSVSTVGVAAREQFSKKNYKKSPEKIKFEADTKGAWMDWHNRTWYKQQNR